MFSPKNLIVTSRTGLVSAALALCFVTIVPQNAQARSGWQNRVPNNFNCSTCHVNPGGGGTRNAFGLTVEDNLGDRGPEWAGIYDIDSDGDGYTNGEELCDPDGTWRPGDANPNCDEITRPGDPNSKPTESSMDMGVDMPADVDMGVDMPADIDMPADVDMPADIDMPADVDMGSGSSGEDMAVSGGQDMAVSGGDEDMGTSASEDMDATAGGGSMETPAEDDDEGCAQAGLGGSPAGGGLGLLAVLGFFGLLRRRRA